MKMIQARKKCEDHYPDEPEESDASTYIDAVGSVVVQVQLIKRE